MASVWHAAQIADTNLLFHLLECGADIEKRGGSPVPSTPLQIACLYQCTDVLKILLKFGANTDARDDLGKTVLQVASFEGSFRVVELLLRSGSNVHARSKDGKTALHFAVSHGRIDVVEALICGGANVNSIDNHGWTPLHYAAEHRTPDVIFALLRHNANILENADGCTPADVARNMGRFSIADSLEFPHTVS